MFVSRLFQRLSQRMSVVFNKKNKNKAMYFYEYNKGKSWAAAGLATYGAYEALSFEVEPENIAILVNRLTHNVARRKVFVEGTYFRIPLLQQIVVYPDQMRPIKCANKKSEVTLKFRIMANPVPKHLSQFYKEVGDNSNSFMEEQIDAALKDVLADCQVRKFFTEEKAVEDKLKEKLAEKLDGNFAVEVQFSSVIYGPRPQKESTSPNKESKSL